MNQPRLEVRDVLGERVVTLEKLPCTIGRLETNDFRLGGSEISPEHVEILMERGRYVLRARESRYGTFHNGEAVTQCELRSGDRVRLGRGAGADLLFFTGEEPLVRSGGSAHDL